MVLDILERRRRDGRWVAKWRRLTGSERLALVEAMLLVAAVAPVIRLAPFRRLGRMASLRIRRPLSDASRRRETIETVTWAVWAAGKRSPMRALCFESGLAAQIMLRRRGVDSRLYFGVAPPSASRITAHVWVVADGLDVSGGEVADQYAPLAVFPPGPSFAGGS